MAYRPPARVYLNERAEGPALAECVRRHVGTAGRVSIDKGGYVTVRDRGRSRRSMRKLDEALRRADRACGWE